MKADEFYKKVLIGPDNFDTQSNYFFNGVTTYESWDDFKSKKDNVVQTTNNYVKFCVAWQEEAKKNGVKTASLMISVKLAVVIIKALTTPDGYKILKQSLSEELSQVNLVNVGKKIKWYASYFAYQESILSKLAENVGDTTHKKLCMLMAKAFGQLAEQTNLANREVIKHVELKYGK